MKSLLLIVASVFALNAVAADAPKAATAPAKVEKKESAKPAKSAPVKKEAPKADQKAPAAK